MNISQLSTLLVFKIILCLTACQKQPKNEVRDDLKKHYSEFDVEGSFVMYDQNDDKYIFYNQSQFKEAFSPASTFKICNSLIGLETGVIKNENFVISWDSVMCWNKHWNKDHNLKSAIKYSVVWYYQELARRVGGQQMKYWLDKAAYGNADTLGGIYLFWLKGGLRITPEQQINFLKKLHHNNLPFSQRSIDIVKNILIVKDTLDFVVRAKTGWADEENRYVGWYVGYIEKNNNVYYFSNCIQTSNLDHKDFGRARTEIAYQILDDLEIINY